VPTKEKEVITYYLHLLLEPIIINDRLIKYIAISTHCDKHKEHGISQGLIVQLVKLLDTGDFDFDGIQGEKKNYFKAYPKKDNKKYKLVWWWWKEIDTYLWVRTCHPK